LAIWYAVYLHSVNASLDRYSRVVHVASDMS
jgi:hypothetical protein